MMYDDRLLLLQTQGGSNTAQVCFDAALMFLDCCVRRVFKLPSNNT